MSDARLKKKVQLKQKTDTPVVQLKRKGEAAEAVHLKKKTDSAAAVAAAAAAATAFTAAAAAVKGVTAEAASAVEAKKTGSTQGQFKQAGAGTAATAGPVNSKSGVSGSTTTGAESVSGKRSTGTFNASEKGKGGKVLGWILGAVALAGLAFGGYKLVDNNKGYKSLLADDETVIESAEAGNSAVDGGAATAQDNQSAAENTTEGTALNASENAATNGANSSDGSASGAKSISDTSAKNAANGSSKDAGSNDSPSSEQGVVAAGNTTATISTANSKSSAATAAAAGKPRANSSSTSATEVEGVNAAPAFIANKVSDTEAVCLFGFDSSVVVESSALNAIAEAAQKSGKTVTISGYTDKVGNDEYNQWLSDRRANAIRAYLVKRGVPSDKIHTRGYGVCKTYSTNAENRRADISLD